jgi:hypothetical protein
VLFHMHLAQYDATITKVYLVGSAVNSWLGALSILGFPYPLLQTA